MKRQLYPLYHLFSEPFLIPYTIGYQLFESEI